MPTLFDPITVGELRLPSRIVMAPLTRARAGGERVPNALMAEYYSQRASAGMIISEATSVTPMGVGYADTPGVWSPEQVEGWKLVTGAVHAAGGRMLLQLWHVGRVSDPCFLNGALPVAPSAIAPGGLVRLVRPQRPYVTPRALGTEELPGVVEAYRTGARNAQLAGFDGVEVHGANGYLLDQFLQDGSNHRKDQYGGSIENRARLMLEVADAVISVWGAGRVGMHLAPRGDAQSMGDSDPAATFGYVARELSRRKIAFICARESLGAKRIGRCGRLRDALHRESGPAPALRAQGRAQRPASGILLRARPERLHGLPRPAGRWVKAAGTWLKIFEPMRSEGNAPGIFRLWRCIAPRGDATMPRPCPTGKPRHAS
jgi:2,4-dienoyl-CoA reductase-like NADH-dependent reductase (Old Yellow Enzyme family)